MKWNEENTIRFIEIYRNKEILWNSKHPQHYNKIIRHDVWLDVSKEIGFTVDECRRKINGLLSAMRREKSKIKKNLRSGRDAYETYKSSWYAYNSMKFLWDKDTPCQITSSIPNEKEIDINENTVTDNVECDVLATPTSSPCSSLPPPSQPIIKKRKTTEDSRLDKAFELLTASVANSINDESQDFGNFVAKKLRKYSAKTQSLVQNAIMGIFLNAENGLYEQPLYSYHHSSNHKNVSHVSTLTSPYITPTTESIPPTHIEDEDI